MLKAAVTFLYCLRTALNPISRASISTKPIGNMAGGGLVTVSKNKRAEQPYRQFHGGPYITTGACIL